MSKKTLKAAAILVSVCFILTLAPVLNGAERKPVKVSILSLLRQPLVLLSYMLRILPPPLIDDGILNNSTKEIIPSSVNTKGIVKTTGDENVTPPIKHD
jgi:hypothetical protein